MTIPRSFLIGIRHKRRPSIDDHNWWVKTFAKIGQPAAVCGRLTDGIEGRRDNVLDILEPLNDRASLEITGFKDHSQVFWTGRTFLLKENRLNMDVASVEPDFQGKGIGKRLAANCFKIATSMGLARITITTIGLGNYVWARAGFLPSSEEWLALRKKVKDFVPKIEGVHSEQAELIDTILSHDEVKGVWALADFESHVRVSTRGGLLEVSLGTALLYHSEASWQGSIEIGGPNADLQQLARFRDYVRV
jgi:GNAT superfamily N-acetyltransferase